VKYVSTRGTAPAIGFEDVILSGVAPDGGLYVPADWPRLSESEIAALAGEPYEEAAVRVMMPFVGDAIERDTFHTLVHDAYRAFANRAIAPLRQIDGAEWLLELFHGPTLAFKDIALQLLGRLFEHMLARRGGRVTIVVATSGDTGSAAIEAFRGRHGIEIFVLHPEGRVSPVQRRQMTTVLDDNVHNIAVAGTFDDCQALVKELFADRAFRDEVSLSAVNSINWVRVMAQSVYYMTAAAALGAPARPIAFAVPTGNFGDVYAGYVARRLGLPVERLVVATNRNDILARFFATGTYAPAMVAPTISPSMDIQVASNFERLLFELYGRSGERVTAAMAELKATRQFSVDAAELDTARSVFDGVRIDEADTLATIASLHRDYALLVDPHSAVGVAAARARHHAPSVPVVALATAHAAKFPDAVAEATGIRPALPAHLADLMTRKERYHPLANDLASVRDYIIDLTKREK